ncbi:MAG: 16S rRNA (guanine(527)-N(7))-methyltransferase RsmG [Wenzhouxiangellaceae bacterium]|nr:16S rRNA (guanine(527)-N(7))-methyltransferase RsmG [Wenzhouxiangellaceae bacterium]
MDATTRELQRRQIGQGLDALGQALDAQSVERLVDYLAELSRWNAAYNLTAVDDPREMVERHLVDSLSIRPHLRGKVVLDAGTGAGLPGLVLAIAEPQRRYLLVDSNGKKVRFLRHVCRKLELGHVEPLHARLESLPLDPPPDEIVARALAPLERLVAWTRPWLDAGARLLAMKADLSEDEVAALGEEWNVGVHDLRWPGQPARRTLAVITRSGGR